MTIQWWGAVLLVTALILCAVQIEVWCLSKAIDWWLARRQGRRAEEENRLLGGRPTLMGSDRGWYDRWDDRLDGRDWDDPEGITGNKALNDFAATVEELEAAQASFQVGRLSQSVKDFNEAVMSGKAVPPGARRRSARGQIL